ncbi:hypothetical protein D3C71_2174880 [compost metagenome]
MLVCMTLFILFIRLLEFFDNLTAACLQPIIDLLLPARFIDLAHNKFGLRVTDHLIQLIATLHIRL